MLSFRRDDGIAVSSWSALLAFRIRVSMSAIGSVIDIVRLLLPRALRHARNRPLVRQFAQTDPAEPELLEHGTRTPAAVAPAVGANPVLLRPSGLCDQGLLRHLADHRSPPSAANGSPSPRR